MDLISTMQAYTNLIANEIAESIALKNNLHSLNSIILEASILLVECLSNNKKILLCGNGGSAGDAQHIAAELLVRLKTGNNRQSIPALSLALDPSYLTAVGNDFGFESVFSRALEGLGQEGDVLIGISTSGNSNNIVKAIEVAREKNMKVVLLLGNNGGKMKGQGDVEIIVPSNVTARIQECHILIGHIFCTIIEKRLFNL